MTTTKTKHGPLPWRLETSWDGFTIVDKIGEIDGIIGQAGNYDVPCIQKDNAEFIVKACNSHYDLLEVCKLVKDWFEPMFEHAVRSTFLEHSEEFEILEKARAAITKAEGKDL